MPEFTIRDTTLYHNGVPVFELVAQADTEKSEAEAYLKLIAEAINGHSIMAAALEPFAALALKRDMDMVRYLRTEQPDATRAMRDADIAVVAYPDNQVVMTSGELANVAVKVTTGDLRKARDAREAAPSIVWSIHRPKETR